jgi:hypothetical protein
MDVRDRLRALTEELDRLRTEVRILDEQVEFQTDVAGDARLRAMVSETPLAERESREAGDDLARLVRSRDETRARIDALRAEQDRLLEQLIEPPT